MDGVDGARPILAGLRLIEVSAFVAAPLGGATLAALGADVVRVDPPGGGIDAGRWPLHRGRSLYWAGLNQGKQSATIDTRSERGQALVAGLVADAGTVLTNLPAQGWMAFDRLRERRPDLVMLTITGSHDGSPAVDYTVNAALGFPMVTGPEGWEGPVNHVLPAWDALTGYLAAAGLLAAELHRARTGQGQLVTLSLADVALSVTASLGLIAEAQLVPEPRGRFGNDLYGSFAHDFRTADGRSVIAVALTPRQWRSLVEATGLGEQVAALEARLELDLREEGARFAARREIRALLEPWVRARPLAEVGRVFDRHGVLWGPYRTFQELVREDERCSPANPMFAEVEQPGIGRSLRATSPLAFGAAGRVPARPSPALGEHTEELLRSRLGLSDRELAALRADGVIPGG